MGVSGTGRRLLLVSTNYAPEHAGIGPYATQIAEHWAARGDEVHVLTGMPHYPAWRLDPAYAGVRRAEEERAGVTVHRRRHTVPARQTAVARALFEASVLAGGLSAPPALDRPDAVVAQLPSLAAGVLGARLARRHQVPFVAIVQDLMGAAAAQSGIRGGRAAARAAGAVERYVLRRAALVGVIHETFVAKVAAMGVPEDRIRVVPNWSHIRLPSRPRAEMRARLGWREGRTVLLHAGNMGLKQNLEVLVEAARLDPLLRVVLMGDGNQRERLRALAGGLPNLDFLPPADDGEFPEVLAAADVLVVTQRASVLDMSVPSKLTSYFAAGRPIVAAVAEDSGSAQEITRSGAGLLVPAEDPHALLAAVHALADDPARASALGERGPVYVAGSLSREAGLARVDALLAEALREPASPPATPRPETPRPQPAKPGVQPAPGPQPVATVRAEAGERTEAGARTEAHGRAEADAPIEAVAHIEAQAPTGVQARAEGDAPTGARTHTGADAGAEPGARSDGDAGAADAEAVTGEPGAGIEAVGAGHEPDEPEVVAGERATEVESEAVAAGPGAEVVPGEVRGAVGT